MVIHGKHSLLQNIYALVDIKHSVGALATDRILNIKTNKKLPDDLVINDQSTVRHVIKGGNLFMYCILLFVWSSDFLRFSLPKYRD